jgi:hypothetical protein
MVVILPNDSIIHHIPLVSYRLFHSAEAPKCSPLYTEIAPIAACVKAAANPSDSGHDM